MNGLVGTRTERGSTVLAVDHDPGKVWARRGDVSRGECAGEGDPCAKGRRGCLEGVVEGMRRHRMVEDKVQIGLIYVVAVWGVT